MQDWDYSRKLEALKELLDPRVVAAWLDEVEECRVAQRLAVVPTRPEAKADEPERLLTAKDVCERLQVGRSWLYEHAHWTGFPVIRVGRSLRFRLSEVEAWLVENGAESLVPPR